MNLITKPLFFLVFLLTVGNCFAQAKNESFYAFNANWDPTASIDSCTYFMHEIKKSDTEFICRYYRTLGPMIKQETYKDADLSLANGFFCWYNDKGKIDSSGWVKNFRKDGRWEYFSGDSTLATYYEEYENGKFLKRDTYHASKPSDSTETEIEVIQKEAIFQKGAKDWNKYLERNLRIPERLISIFPNGTYTVDVSFIINKNGKVIDVYLRKSLEWSADAEVFRIVENSPNWQSAIQDGKPVLYRQSQNISFEISK
jgi:protein TonB